MKCYGKGIKNIKNNFGFWRKVTTFVQVNVKTRILLLYIHTKNIIENERRRPQATY